MRISFQASALALAALLAGAAVASEAPVTDSGKGSRGIMSADTNGDGKISKDEFAALRDQKHVDWFDKMDADKDGFLTPEELRQARDVRRDHKRGEKQARMEQRFKEADINGDGQLSLDEAQAKMPRLAERFTSVDTDHDGLLSKEELRHGRKRSGESR